MYMLEQNSIEFHVTIYNMYIYIYIVITKTISYIMNIFTYISPRDASIGEINNIINKNSKQ